MAYVNDKTIDTASSINLIVGIWLILAPFVLNYAFYGANAANDVILGIVIAILALVRMTNHQLVWPSWLTLVAALWLIVSPFVLGYSGIAQVIWNDIIAGIVVGALAITSAAGNPIDTTV